MHHSTTARRALLGAVLACPPLAAFAAHDRDHVSAQHPTSRVVMHDSMDRMVRDVMLYDLFVRELMPPERPGRIIGAEGGYTNGDFGAGDDATLYDSTVGIGRSWGRFGLSGSIPYYYLDSDGTTENGLGDVRVRASWDFIPRTRDRWSVTGTALVKLPTGDEDENLSNGETDYGGLVTVAGPVGNLRLSAVAGYIIKGDTPATDYDNPLIYSVGITRPMGNYGVYGSFDGSTSTLSGVDDYHAVGIGAYRVLPQDYTVSLDVTAGLNEDSSDLGISAGISRWW